METKQTICSFWFAFKQINVTTFIDRHRHYFSLQKRKEKNHEYQGSKFIQNNLPLISQPARTDTPPHFIGLFILFYYH